MFIIGAPRSGTTLLKTVLVAHSQLTGTDYESTGIFRYRDLDEYWLGDLERNQLADLVRHSQHVVTFFDGLVNLLLVRNGAEQFVDKLTIRNWRLRFVVKHFPKARFVNIVRDGRDCLCSARRHPNVSQSDSVLQFARYWQNCVRIPVSTIPADRMTTISYESFTNRPEETLRALMCFLRREFESTQLDPDVYSGASTMSKRAVHRNLAREITSRSQQRWRSELSAREQAVFCAVAGLSLRECGYEID